MIRSLAFIARTRNINSFVVFVETSLLKVSCTRSHHYHHRGENRIKLTNSSNTFQPTNHQPFCSLSNLLVTNQRGISNFQARGLIKPSRKRKPTEPTPLAIKFKMEWPKITCFGDSLTRRSKDPDNGCWASYISHQTLSFYDTDVRGFEGYNTRWAFELMPKLFPKSYLDKVEIFISFFGHNDSWGQGSPLGIPVDEYESNSRAMIKYLNDNGVDSSKIILITPAWYFKEDFDIMLKNQGFPPAGKTKEECEAFANAIKRVASDNNITCIDFYKITADYQPLPSIFCDGVHLSRKGAKILFDLVWPEVEKRIVTRHGKNLQDVFHVVPVERRPEIAAAIRANREKEEAKNK